MILRNIEKYDNKFLAELTRKIFKEYNAPLIGTAFFDPTTDNLFDLFENPQSVLWVAEENGQFFGCCGIYPTDGFPTGYAEL